MEPPRTHYLHARLFLLSRSSGLVSPSTPVSRLTCLFACGQFVLSTVLSVFLVHVSARLFLVYKHLFGFGFGLVFLFLALGRIALRRWSRRLFVYFSFVSFTQKGRRFMLFNRQLRQVNPATTFSRDQCRNPQRINS